MGLGPIAISGYCTYVEASKILLTEVRISEYADISITICYMITV